MGGEVAVCYFERLGPESQVWGCRALSSCLRLDGITEGEDGEDWDRNSKNLPQLGGIGERQKPVWKVRGRKSPAEKW